MHRAADRGPPPLDLIPAAEWGSACTNCALEPRGRLRAVVLHHTALESGDLRSGERRAELEYMLGIERLHLDRGWSCIGYHYVVMPSGSVLAGRPEDAQGAHALGHNHGTLGVAVAGNLELDPPTPAMLESLLALLERLSVPPAALLTHADLDPNTVCPGRLLLEALPLRCRPIRGPAASLARGHYRPRPCTHRCASG